MTQATLPDRTAPEALPRPIRRVLGRLNRRLRAAAVLRGLGTVALVLAAGVAVGTAVDFAWVLPQGVRWVIWGAWLGAGGLALLAKVAGPAVRRARALDLAAVAERGQPELGERLTGAVSLLTAGAHGSSSLIAAVANDAAARAKGADLRRAVTFGSALRRLALGAIAAGLVAAPALVSRPYRALAQRFVAPWSDVERVGRWVVKVAPGDQVVALGSDLAFSAEVRPRFGKADAPEVAWLEWTEAGGTSHRVAMPATDESASVARAFAVTLPRVSGSFVYRVVSGTAQSRRYTITALEPPAVATLSIRVEPPAYTKRAAETARDPRRIEAWEGSRVVLEASANTAVRSIAVEWPGEKESKTKHELTLGPGGRTATVALTAESSGTFAFTLRDEHGLASRPEMARRLVVRPDAPPVVAAKGPSGIKESRPDDTLRVAVAARDDVAVASVELHYTVERAGTQPESGHIDAPLGGLGTKAVRGAAALELKTLGLKPGDALTYRVRVADNRPAPRGPNVVWTNEQSFDIVAAADPMLARQRAARRDDLQAKLDALKKSAAENRKETEQLRYSADAAQRGNGEWDRERQQTLAERETEARGVADRLQLLARDFDAEHEFHALARPARQIAEVEAEAARAVLDQARRADDAEERLNDLRQADARLGSVVDRLNELQQQFDALAKRDADRERLDALARREAELAARAEAMQAAPDRAQLDKLQAEQNAVRNDLDELLRKSPELKAEVLAAQAKDADELARRARALAERQREEARQATDLSKQADKFKALAEAQRAIEDEARRLALEVDSPLAENARGRLNAQAVREPVAPLEHGAMDEARQRLEGAEGELRRLAREIEDVPGDAKALARRLVQRQDQLNGQVAEALAEFRDKKELKADDQAALTHKLKPLADRQEAIANLAKALAEAKPAAVPNHRVPDALFETARQATAKATEGLREAAKPKELDARQQEARRDLARLADALPDPWRRQETARHKLDEARRATHEVAGELERHLRETTPQPGKPHDPAKLAAELARRLAPVAQKQAKAAEALATLEPEARAVPQRDRAARRAKHFAEVLDAAQKQAENPNQMAALRAQLPTLQVEARAAFDRLEQKMNNQFPADDLAAELAAEQPAQPGKLDRPEDRAEAAREQRRRATALRNLHVPDAALEHAEAVRLADRAADAVANPPAPQAAAQALQRAKDGADALARRLTDQPAPRAEAAALARAERALNEPEAQLDPAGAAQRQKAIADAVTRLPLEGKAQAADKARHAAELAERARNGDTPHADALAKARDEAAQALDALAAGAPEDAAPPPAAAPPHGLPDPDLGLKPAQAEQARALARRERQLRENLQALLGEHVAPQQALRRDTAAVGRDLAALRDRARGLSDRAHGPAHEAAQLLGEHAPRAMDQGSEHLAQGQPGPAREDQRRAAEMVERGAQQAEDLAAALRADRPGDSQAQGNAQAQGELGAAREAFQHAQNEIDQAREPGQGPASMHAAGQAMRQAADQLHAAAQARPGQGQTGEPDPSLAAQDVPGHGDPKGQDKDPHSKPGGTAVPDLTALQDMIRAKTGRSWGELPGHLRTEILQMSQSRYRDDYARLIQLYYREIAAGAEREPQP